ncbi:hypothetical protein J6590_003035 [Homalodisca vitripennis]|nr:hypothetical protein J6590_003035 [Homalodisca vitripennis]
MIFIIDAAKARYVRRSDYNRTSRRSNSPRGEIRHELQEYLETTPPPHTHTRCGVIELPAPRELLTFNPAVRMRQYVTPGSCESGQADKECTAGPLAANNGRILAYNLSAEGRHRVARSAQRRGLNKDRGDGPQQLWFSTDRRMLCSVRTAQCCWTVGSVWHLGSHSPCLVYTTHHTLSHELNTTRQKKVWVFPKLRLRGCSDICRPQHILRSPAAVKAESSVKHGLYRDFSRNSELPLSYGRVTSFASPESPMSGHKILISFASTNEYSLMNRFKRPPVKF